MVPVVQALVFPKSESDQVVITVQLGLAFTTRQITTKGRFLYSPQLDP